MMLRRSISKAIPYSLALAAFIWSGTAGAGPGPVVHYRFQDVDGVKVFYRESGPPDAPVVVLLHGFPTSSHMYRDLIPKLARKYRVLAPDYPGYGQSDAPAPARFCYTFDNLAMVIDGFLKQVGATRYVLYLQDFGGPVGFRIAAAHPERVAGLIVQNAVAHEAGLSPSMAPAREYWQDRKPATEAPMRELLKLETTRFQFVHGAKNVSRISPDAWVHAQAGLDRPGSDEIQLALLFDYQSNLRRYPEWQAYLRRHRPPTLVVWGKNDPFFTVAGAHAYKRENPGTEVHLFDTGHFALEEFGEEIAAKAMAFLQRVYGAGNSPAAAHNDPRAASN